MRRTGGRCALTVAASAVAAATAANSGNDLAFLMYELLLGGCGGIRNLGQIGREELRFVGAQGECGPQSGSQSADPAAGVGELVEAHGLAVRELPDVGERHVERLAGGLGASGVAPDRDDVVVAGEHLFGDGVEVLPPLLVDRVEDGRAHRGQAVVDAAVRQSLGLVPDDRVVHHRQRRIEVTARERLVGTPDGVEVLGLRGQGGDSRADVINYQYAAARRGRRTAAAAPTGSCRRSRPRPAS